MKAQTVWNAYQRAKALANWSVWDHKARRHELLFRAWLERIIGEYDVAMEKKADFFRVTRASTIAEEEALYAQRMATLRGEIPRTP